MNRATYSFMRFEKISKNMFRYLSYVTSEFGIHKAIIHSKHLKRMLLIGKHLDKMEFYNCKLGTEGIEKPLYKG